MFLKAADFKKFMAMQNNPANPMWETWTTGKFLSSWSKDIDGVINNFTRKKFNVLQNLQSNNEVQFDKKDSNDKTGNSRYPKTSYSHYRQRLEGIGVNKPQSIKRKIEFKVNRKSVLQRFPKPRCHNEITKMLRDLVKGAVATPRTYQFSQLSLDEDENKLSRNLLKKWMSTPDMTSKPRTPYLSLNRPKKNPYFELLKKQRLVIN